LFVANLLIFFYRPLLIALEQLQDAVTTAHETSDAFSDETLREQAVFQYAKEAEMKEMLGNLADGQIEFYKAASIDVFPSSLH
jgi:sorting nexin-4